MSEHRGRQGPRRGVRPLVDSPTNLDGTRRRSRARLWLLASLWVAVWVTVWASGWETRALAEEPAADRQLRVLLIAQGPDGHPANTHEYRAGLRILAAILKQQPHLDVQVVSADGDWTEGPELIREADGVVLYVSEGARWIHADPRRLEAFAQLAAKGGGLTSLHWGMGTRDARYIEGFVKLFGGCHGGPDRKYKVVDDAQLDVVEAHPITRGIEDFAIRDEFYYRLKFMDAPQSIASLITTSIEGRRETVAWAWQRVDGGRSFGFTGLHFHGNWQRPEYRRFVAQGVLWTLERPIPEQGINVDVPEQLLTLPPPPANDSESR